MPDQPAGAVDVAALKEDIFNSVTDSESLGDLEDYVSAAIDATWNVAEDHFSAALQRAEHRTAALTAYISEQRRLLATDLALLVAILEQLPSPPTTEASHD